MNQAHYHLILNHAPIIGPAFGVAVLLAGFIFKSQHIKRAALGVFVLTALLAIPAFLTGEGAEEIVEKIPGINETTMETHEELGETFLWLVSMLGVVAVITFIVDLRLSALSRWFYLFTIAIAIATLFVAKSVGTSGGEIRHTEISTGSTPAMAPNGAGEKNNGTEKEEEKD